MSKLLEKFKNSDLVTTTFENWGNIDSLISIIIIAGTVILSLIKLYKSYKSKSELQVYISKNDLKNLKFYIPTYGQDEDPCENEEIKNAIAEDRTKLIPFFMDIIKKDLHGRYFMILADSGMGKSTFLQKLYIKYRKKLFCKKKILYYSLSNWKDLEDIKNTSDKHKTILLLDSLDEDQYALENYNKRLDDIIKTTQDFYKVIITSRTQFFPNRDSEPESTKLISNESSKKSNRFKRIYLSPFNDNDVEAYLLKKFKFNASKRKSAKKIIKECPDLMVRPMLLGFIDILIDTKKDEYKEIPRDIVGIYEIIVNEWIEREENDLIPRERLEKFTYDIVMYMYRHDKLDITQKEIEKLCKQGEIELLKPVFARSKSLLNRTGNGVYKFAHKSIYEFLLTKYLYEKKNFQEDFLLKIITKEINHIYYVSYYFSLNVEKSEMLLQNKNFNGRTFEKANFNLLVDKKVYSNVTFKNTDLSNANLSFANLQKVFFWNVDLSNAKLQGADLRNASFRLAKLQGANFQNADLQDVDLSYTDLQGTDFQDVDLRYTKLQGVDFQNALLRNADLQNTDLRGVKLQNADLRNADLQNTDLQNADLRNADLQGALLRNADLQGADLSNVKLQNADLQNTDLRNTKLQGVDFQSVDLQGADLRNTDLRGAKLKGAKLKGAKLF